MAGHLCLRLISRISSVYSNHKMLLSSCDSRNLNLSPFCNLTSTSLAMWQPSVLETYGNLKTDYIEQISGPLRLKYPNSMADEELITALTKVKPCKGLCSNLPPHTNKLLNTQNKANTIKPQTPHTQHQNTITRTLQKGRTTRLSS